MDAARCSSLVLMLLLSCCGAAAADENLTHLHFYFHEVVLGAPNSTVVHVAGGQHMGGGGAPAAFGDVNVFDNALREGADPASRLIGRVQGFSMNASLDGSGVFSAFDFVFSGDDTEYGGSTLTAQGRYDPAGGPSERSVVGGTGKLRFARGYVKSRLVSSTNTTIVVAFDVYFTLLAH